MALDHQKPECGFVVDRRPTADGGRQATGDRRQTRLGIRLWRPCEATDQESQLNSQPPRMRCRFRSATKAIARVPGCWIRCLGILAQQGRAAWRVTSLKTGGSRAVLPSLMSCGDVETSVPQLSWLCLEFGLGHYRCARCINAEPQTPKGAPTRSGSSQIPEASTLNPRFQVIGI